MCVCAPYARTQKDAIELSMLCKLASSVRYPCQDTKGRTAKDAMPCVQRSVSVVCELFNFCVLTVSLFPFFLALQCQHLLIYSETLYFLLLLLLHQQWRTF